MRASVSVSMPDLHLEPGRKILSLDGFVKTMEMIDPLANNEANTGYENPRFVSKSFKKTGENILNACYLYNISRQRSRTGRDRIRSFRNSGYDTWDSGNTQAYTQLNGITIDSGGSLTIANSGTGGFYIGGLDTATTGSYTTYRITGDYH